MGVKINLKIVTKNHAGNSEKRFLAKSISKPYGCATALPTAWDLMNVIFFIFLSNPILEGF